MNIARQSLVRFGPDLSERSRETEWLDRPDIPRDELAAVLRDLDRFNGTMLGQWPIVRWLARATRRIETSERITVLDVGCGSGDLLRAIRRWSLRVGRTVDLIGLDLSPDTVAIARDMTDDESIRFVAADVFHYAPAAPVDFIVSGLMTHHLPNERIVDLLRWMDATARRGWLISDLQRHIVPYAFIGLVGKLTSIHPTVIHDGRISVARAFTHAEWRALIGETGLHGVSIRWMLYRLLIGRVRDGAK